MLCFPTIFPHFTLHTTVRDLGVTLDSALTFSLHISHLIRSSYFQLRRLRTIRKAVSVTIFTSIVHAFVCSMIDYCNSLLIGLPMTRLSPLQTVLNTAARLIARLPRYSHISYYIKEHLHWLPISTRIEYKVLLIVLKAQMGVAPKYLRDVILLPTSATSLRPLHSMDRRELFVPRARTTMAMSRSFAVIAPALWIRLPPSARASLLSSTLSTSLSLLKTCPFYLEQIEPKAPLFAFGCVGALYKYLNTIRYKKGNVVCRGVAAYEK